MHRSLALRREPLADLTPDELTAVAGGQAITNDGVTCPARLCAQEILTAFCDITNLC